MLRASDHLPSYGRYLRAQQWEMGTGYNWYRSFSYRPNRLEYRSEIYCGYSFLIIHAKNIFIWLTNNPYWLNTPIDRLFVARLIGRLLFLLSPIYLFTNLSIYQSLHIISRKNFFVPSMSNIQQSTSIKNASLCFYSLSTLPTWSHTYITPIHIHIHNYIYPQCLFPSI